MTFSQAALLLPATVILIVFACITWMILSLRRESAAGMPPASLI